MYLKLTSCLAFVTLLSLSCTAQRVNPRKVKAFNENTLPAPEGMAYVPGGSITIRYGGDSANIKKYSLSPFFIDKTEVTNSQYREFVNWVIDSVAIAGYLKDASYFRDAIRDSNMHYINWSKVNHSKLWKDQSRLQAMYQNGEVRKDLYNFRITYTRAGKPGQADEVTEVVNIYPDTRVWAKDFPNSQTDLIMKDYFTNRAFDDYPVVGVTWKQARAYAQWKTNRYHSNAGGFLADYHLPYTLPSEAQWVHAAKGSGTALDSTVILRDGKNRLMANFKQGEGEYTEDGSSYTVPVMAYSPNAFGLYNMLGNVAEWVLDAYNVSAGAFVHDQNPVLLYDAEDTESDFMRSKVVRGGSWKDNAMSLSPYARNYEVQDAPHSYIGFRLVMPAPEILGKQVQTRKKR